MLHALGDRPVHPVFLADLQEPKEAREYDALIGETLLNRSIAHDRLECDAPQHILAALGFPAPDSHGVRVASAD